MGGGQTSSNTDIATLIKESQRKSRDAAGYQPVEAIIESENVMKESSLFRGSAERNRPQVAPSCKS